MFVEIYLCQFMVISRQAIKINRKSQRYGAQ